MNPSDAHTRSSDIAELRNFEAIGELKNHWARPTGPRSYYWYLTFEDCQAVRDLAEYCQRRIRFPYYDLVPPGDLHLTLDRIAFEGSVTQAELRAIHARAVDIAGEIPAFDVAIGSLGGTPGALGFLASPVCDIQRVRDALRGATLSVRPDAPVRAAAFHPHVAIAYANTDCVSTREAAAVIEGLVGSPHVTTTVRTGRLVLLERMACSYVWRSIARVPLRSHAGRTCS